MSTPNTLGGGHALNEQPVNDLDQTLAALEGGPMTLNPDSAVSIVRTWHESLRQSEAPELHHIADLLEALQEELASDRLDGPTIGDLMVSLGGATRSAGTEAGDERIMPRLDRLATLLTTAGQALGGSVTDSDTAGPAGASAP